MAALTAPTAASDNSGSTERLVKKYFRFTDAVNDNDTFACPMADVKIAQFIPDGATPAYSSVEIGASSAGVTALTINLSASVTGWLVVEGTGV